MFKIHLFGPPRILDSQGRMIDIPRRSARVLLYYLAACAGPVARDSVSELFWLGNREKAHAGLADLVSKLRNKLGNKQVIYLNNDFVELNLNLVGVDWPEFQRLVSAHHLRPLAGGSLLAANVYLDLAQAMNLWNGRPLFDSADLSRQPALEDWLQKMRTDAESLIWLALESLIAHETGANQPENAIRWLELARQLDKEDESTNLALLNMYLRARRYDEARDFYKKLERLYTRPEMPESILAAGRQMEDASRRDPFPPPDRWGLHHGLSLPFVGQGEAMLTLQTLARTSAAVLVTGEGGSGKTRLLYEFARQQPESCRIMVASCQPIASNQPFAPWASMLRADIHAYDWQILDPAWAATLNILFPDIAAYRTDLGTGRSDSDPSLRHTVILEAIFQLLLNITRNEKLILVFDDVQWADEASLAALSYLLKKSLFKPGGALLLLASRFEEYSDLLDKFLRSSPMSVRQMEVSPLTQADIDGLAAFVFQRSAPSTLTDRLYRDSGGNPFFATQFLELMEQQNQAWNDENPPEIPLAPSVAKLIENRLRLLSEPAQNTLQMAAILGSPFDVDVAQIAQSVSMDGLVVSIEELEKAHLVRSQRDDPRLYRFIHEKVREALLNQMSLMRKRNLHLRAAQALQNQWASNYHPQAARLAFHFEQAMLYPQAFRYWTAAGQYAWRIGAHHEALKAFGKADKLIPFTPNLSDDDIYMLYASWSQVAFEALDFTVLDSLCRNLIRIGEQRSRPLFLSVAYSGLSDLENGLGRFQQAADFAQRALAQAELAANAHQKARALLRNGMAARMMGGLKSSRLLFQRALTLTEQSDDFLVQIDRGNVLQQMSLVESLRGYPLRGLELAGQALEIHASTRNMHGQMLAYSALSLAHYLTGQYAAGRQAALEGLQMVEQVNSWRVEGSLCGIAGLCEVKMGLADEAFRHATRAREIGKYPGQGEIASMGYRILGDLYLTLQEYQKAAEAYQLSTFQLGPGVSPLSVMVTHRMGYALALDGQEDGFVYLKDAATYARQMDLGSLFVLGGNVEVEMFLRNDNLEQFYQACASLHVEVKTRLKHDFIAPILGLVRARYLFERGNYKSTLEITTPLLAYFRKQRLPWHEIEALWLAQTAAAQLGHESNPQLRARLRHLLLRLQSSFFELPMSEMFDAFARRYKLWPPALHFR